MVVQDVNLNSAFNEVFEEDSRLAPSGTGPLAIILNPSGDISVMAGRAFELSVTITNQGDRSALIKVFIEETSGPVAQWCRSGSERIGLNLYQSVEVVFQFEVPLETPPGTYNYLLQVDAPKHYPDDTPIQYWRRVLVIPFIEETRTATDPTFSLQPATTSIAPARLQPGSQLQLQAFVHNRSDRVDRFYLSCTDLPDSWLSVIYPEGLPLEGMFAPSSDLELNPGDRNQILLLLNPPLDAPAGIYAPTVRLQSNNYPDLILLDVVHLEILPTYLLNVELVTLQGKVKNKAGLFELRFQNLGNTPREIHLRARSTDEEENCAYTFAPDRVRLGIGQEALVGLQVKPTKKWRPFSGQLFNFIVELEDKQQFPLTLSRFQGSLMWEPRPWWQFLLFVLAITGAIASVIMLILWLVTRPPVRPQLVEFFPERSFYQESTGDRIRLSWKIANSEEIESLRLVGLSADGKPLSGPFNYNLTANLPDSLRNFCKTTRENGTKVLLCQNVWTDALAAGSYVFELAVTPKPSRRFFAAGDRLPIALKTNVITISPTPLPKIVEFSSDRPVYEEAQLATAPLPPPDPKTSQSAPRTGSILLNWKITNSSELKGLTLLGRAPDNSVNSALKRYDFSQGIPPELKGYCITAEKTGELPVLQCENVPTGSSKAGDYVFEMALFPKNSADLPSETVRTNNLKILPFPQPKILEFAAAKQGDRDAAAIALNSDPLAQPPAAPSSNFAFLNWKLANPKQLEELTAIGRDSNNSVTSPLKRYDFSYGMPAELQPYCAIQGAPGQAAPLEGGAETLVCQNVPAEAAQVGEYIFELTVIPKQNRPERLDSQKTEKIKITAEPIPTEIARFNLNDQPAPPKYIVNLATEKERFILLSWNVQGSKNIKVELLPSPGTVLPQGQVVYPISPEPGAETLTLQVTNEEGQQIKRSVIVERFAPPTPPPPPGGADKVGIDKAGAGGIAPGGIAPGGIAPGGINPGGTGAAGSVTAGSGADKAGADKAGADKAGAGGTEADGTETTQPLPEVPLEPAELSPQVN